MATIKSYTDISQSKKLAKILSLESADMWHHGFFTPNRMCKIEYNPPTPYHSVTHQWDCPCWSLAALISILPKNLNIGRPSLESNYKGYYWIQYYDGFMKPNNYRTKCFNNPVDACVEMIIKLYEVKLI